MGFTQAYTLYKYPKIRAEGAENFGFFLGPHPNSPPLLEGIL